MLLLHPHALGLWANSHLARSICHRRLPSTSAVDEWIAVAASLPVLLTTAYRRLFSLAYSTQAHPVDRHAEERPLYLTWHGSSWQSEIASIAAAALRDSASKQDSLHSRDKG